MMHHIQKNIILELSHKEKARFADLKPPKLDSNIFTYHLKQLIAAKLLSKSDDGFYSLSQKGKLAGINIRLDTKSELEQAHSVIYMVARNSTGKWLLRKRLVHPAYGKVGFLHAEPSAYESIYETAAKLFKMRTALKAEFEVRGSGYLTLMRGNELESFSHFTLLYAESIEGELSSPGTSGENFWYEGNFKDPKMFPNMLPLIKQVEGSDNPFFIELKDNLED